jgi:hypothetical protein
MAINLSGICIDIVILYLKYRGFFYIFITFKFFTHSHSQLIIHSILFIFVGKKISSLPTSVSKRSEEVRGLDLSFNNFKTLPNLEDFLQLRVLNVAGNQLDEIPHSSKKNLLILENKFFNKT